jgi:hypothetical protein
MWVIRVRWSGVERDTCHQVILFKGAGVSGACGVGGVHNVAYVEP